MNILGVTAFVHDSCASLIQDGDIVASIEEERFSRVKHTDEFPRQAIEYVLSQGGIDIGDVDIIAFNWDPYLSLKSELLKLLLFPIYYKIMKYNKPPKNFKTIISTFLIRRYLSKTVGAGFKGKIVWVPHHLSHAASSFYLSPYDNADVLIMDGHGENSSVSYFKAQESTITLKWKIPIRHSLGILYSNITNFLGFGPWQEGKTMALASFGKYRYKELFSKIIKHHPDGKFSLANINYLGLWNYSNGKLAADIGVPKEADSEFEQHHKDLAYSMQERIKETVLHVLRNNAQKNSNKHCCMAGGLFLNCDINRAVQNSGFYESYFIPPFASDTGGAIGAALYAAYGLGNEQRKKLKSGFSPFVGPSYSDEMIEEALHKSGLEYDYTKTPWIDASRAIVDNNIVGWFQGAVEAGPRALGNRSIIANPGNKDIRDILNVKIKKRESFRPFAPMVTEQEALRCFDIVSPIPETARYMLLTSVVKAEFRDELAGITHVDGTARLQVVRESWSPETYQLLLELQQITGFGISINTSFNRHEPIVCSPADAINTYLTTGLDMLVMGNFVLRKI